MRVRDVAEHVRHAHERAWRRQNSRSCHPRTLVGRPLLRPAGEGRNELLLYCVHGNVEIRDPPFRPEPPKGRLRRGERAAQGLRQVEALALDKVRQGRMTRVWAAPIRLRSARRFLGAGE